MAFIHRSFLIVTRRTRAANVDEGPLGGSEAVG
jgi:hypothetical protein